MLELAWEGFKVAMFVVGCGATLFIIAGVVVWLRFYKEIEWVRNGK